MKNNFKTLLNSLSFYRKKTYFFVIIFALATLGYYMLSQQYSADDIALFSNQSSADLEINMVVKEDGNILLNGKSIGNKIDVYVDYDELRLPVIDKGGNYYSSVTINLKVPSNSGPSVKHEIIAIHGVGKTSSNMEDDGTIVYKANDVSKNATISIVAKFPKGIISIPVLKQTVAGISQVKDNYWLVIAVVLPLITLIYTLAFLFYQLRRHRIEIPEKEISAPPMAIPPAIVGALYNQKVGPREIAATLIDLAQRGDIVILDRDRDFAFGKAKFDQRLLGFEKLLLSKIFKNNISSNFDEIEKRINNHFYSKKISIVTAGIYALATRLGYFKISPQRIHSKYRIIGTSAFIIALIGFVLSLLLFTNPPYIVFFWVGMMASSLIIAFTAGNMPLRTTIGQEVLSNWFAFKKFLSNPDDFPYSENYLEIFNKYLPYAIVMDCETAWARRFKNHNFTMPDWFLTERGNLGLEDFCLSLFPIVSYVGRSLAALREPGFE